MVAAQGRIEVVNSRKSRGYLLFSFGCYNVGRPISLARNLSLTSHPLIPSPRTLAVHLTAELR